MNFIGGIEGMDFTPVAGYNSYLKNTMAFGVDNGLDFESVLNSQQAALHQAPNRISGGIEMNMGFDDIMSQKIQSANKTGSAGDLLNSLSKSIGGGIDSVNNANMAAEKAQESFAMGEDISVHDVMIAAEKSNLSMQMAMQLRNKMVAAYTEINNIRV